MFYYRFAVVEKLDDGVRTRIVHRQYGTGAFAQCGEDVATMMANSKVASVHVAKISQAAYIRATRPGE